MKINGHRPTHRNKWQILRYGLLSKEALLFFEFLLDQMDFDHNHFNFGTVEINAAEVAHFFNVSPGTIYNWRNELKNAGFVKKRKKDLYSISQPSRYVTVGKEDIPSTKASYYTSMEKDQPPEKIFESITNKFEVNKQNFQNIEKNTFQIAEGDTSISKVPSKVNSNNINFTNNDVDWINENVNNDVGPTN